ncbi:MAG: ribosome maturation factor RimM [Syntrophobacteraceae bacterium]
MKRPRLIPVGRVVKLHGVRGALKIQTYGETLGELKAGEKLFAVASEAGAQREVTLAAFRGHRRGLIGEFEEIGDIDQALELVGRELFIPEDRLPVLPEGEYYHYRLIGLAVETKEGRVLGTLRTILETGGNDVYVVVDGEKELLVPAIEDVIREVDLEVGKMIVDLPEGLE